MIRVLSLIFTFFIIAATAFADSRIIDAVLKDSAGNNIGLIRYMQKSDNNVSYNISVNSGIQVKEIGSRDIPLLNDKNQAVGKAKVISYEIYNPITGSGVQLNIAVTENKDERNVSQPMLNEFDELNPFDDGIPQNIFISQKSIQKYIEITSDIPAAFQRQVYYPYSAYNDHVKKNGQVYRRFIKRAVERRKSWNKFKNDISSKIGSYEDREARINKEIQEKINSLHVFNDERDRVNSILSPILDSSPSGINNNSTSTYNSSQDQEEILSDHRESQRQLSDNIFSPSIHSKLLNKKISFDPKNKDDLKALRTYKQALHLKAVKTVKDDRYHELSFSNDLIEIRQNSKKNLDDSSLNALTDISDSIIHNNVKLLVNSFQFLINTGNFQDGLAASLFNNLNPVGLLFPISSGCEENDGFCEAGAYVGDALGILYGLGEVITGVTTITAAGSISIVALSASGTLLTPLVVAGNVTATLAGLTMVAKGASVLNNSAQNMYRRISNSENIKVFSDGIKFAKSSMGKLWTNIQKTARKLGFKTSEGVKDFADLSKRILGNEVGAVGDIAKAIRKSYVREVESLSRLVGKLGKAGKSQRKIAEEVLSKRNQLKVKYRNISPSNSKKLMEERNLKIYGNKIGPDVDYFLNKGNTLDEIIEKASRAGGKDMGL